MLGRNAEQAVGAMGQVVAVLAEGLRGCQYLFEMRRRAGYGL